MRRSLVQLDAERAEFTQVRSPADLKVGSYVLTGVTPSQT
jgi:hypothetical protein